MRQGRHKRRKGLFGLWIVMAVLGLAAPVHSAEGVLLTVSGQVDVESRGASRPGKTGLRVRPGDTVVSLGGQASGILDDGRMFRVGEGESYPVPGDRAGGPAGGLASRLMDTIRETASRGRGGAVKGGDSGGNELRLLYPHNACVLPGEVHFEWEPLEGVDRVKITVKSPSPIYRQTFISSSGETGAFLPGEAPPLEPGVRYYWKVQGAGALEGETPSSSLAWFAVLEPGRIREMEGAMDAVETMDFFEEPDRDVLRASLLISYGLYHRAADILKKGLKRFPKDPGMRELLGGLLLKMKRAEEADAIL